MKNTEKVVFKSLGKFNRNGTIREVQKEHLLREDLRLDSLSMVSVFTHVSKDLKIDLAEFTDEDLVNLSSINSVEDLIGMFEQKTAV